jgi:CRISPR-associated protein Csm3
LHLDCKFGTQKYGKFNEKEKDIVFEDDEEGKTMRNLFEPVDYGDDSIQVSKAIFRDALLTDESRANLEKHLGSGVYTEIKAENKISLLKGKAESPRFIERVPAGAVFGGEILLQVFDEDNEEYFKAKLKEAINMLELNYLGAGGTRGYGKVKVDIKEDFEEVKV